MLFQPRAFPSLLHRDCDGMVDALHHAVASTDMDVQGDMYRNVVLGGALLQVRGMAERVQREVRTHLAWDDAAPASASAARVTAAGPHGVFKGAAALASTRVPWVTREEYDEWGPNIVARKCVP